MALGTPYDHGVKRDAGQDAQREDQKQKKHGPDA